MRVGILAFQGDVREHLSAIKALGASACEVRSVSECEHVDALIIPGGESTVISKFLEETGLRDALIARHREENFPIYGTCAGAILLAREVLSDGVPDPRVSSLGLLDITVERNAYGRQSESFEADVAIAAVAEPPLRGFHSSRTHAIFIRAPKIVRVGEGVEVLVEHDGVPVAVRQGNLLASTFHPELAGEPSLLHRFFVSCVRTSLLLSTG